MADRPAPRRPAGQVRGDCAAALASMLWNEHYPNDRAIVLDLCGIKNAELRLWPQGLSRRIIEGTNIVRRELGLPEARTRAVDPKLYFANVGEAG